jgi:hypothetical protein
VAKLNIFVNEKNGQTVSKFGKAKDGEKIVFHNQHPAQPLSVSVIGEPPSAGVPLSDGTNPVSSFTVSVAEGKKAFWIRAGYLAETFKYTATIQGSVPEDPIIIIERKRAFESPIVAATIGAVAGFVLGLAVGATQFLNMF